MVSSISDRSGAPGGGGRAELPDRGHRWNRNPRPQPHKFSKLVFLI